MVAGDRRQLVKARHRFTARILGTVAALVIVALLALLVETGGRAAQDRLNLRRRLAGARFQRSG